MEFMGIYCNDYYDSLLVVRKNRRINHYLLILNRYFWKTECVLLSVFLCYKYH